MKDTSILEQLRSAIIALDMALTGSSERQAAHAANDSNLKTFISRQEYYLSDGGYSRIIMNEIYMELRLTSNSRNEVKAEWDNHNQLKESVQGLYELAQSIEALK